MSEILIGQAYYLRFDPGLWQAMEPYPPLGSLYAAGMLRSASYDVGVFDSMLAESEEQWGAALDESGASFAVLYEDNFNYLSKMSLLRMRTAAYRMIDLARMRGKQVIVCGADATDNPGHYIQAGADYVVLGEGEQTLRELLDVLTERSESNLSDVLGLAWADGGRASGHSVHWVSNPRRAPLRDLDRLPPPAWDLVDMDRYRRIWRDSHGYFSLNMVTTRGCPYHCNWCAKPIWGQRYNVRSPANVVQEMALLKQRYAPDHLWFMDDILGLQPGWLDEFAELVASAGVQIPFKSLHRADLVLRPGTVDALRRAGAHTVWIGAESGSQRILDAMEKGVRVEQIEEATRRLHAAGIRVGHFLQFGYPGEGWREIQDTRRLVMRTMPDDIGISVSYPLPGTKFYERVQAQMGERHQWRDSADLAMLYRGSYTTAFYRVLHHAVHSEFRLAKAWRSLRAPDARLSQRPMRTHSCAASATRAMVLNASMLPISHLALQFLRLVPNRGARSLPPVLTPSDAAMPSPQPIQQAGAPIKSLAPASLGIPLSPSDRDPAALAGVKVSPVNSTTIDGIDHDAQDPEPEDEDSSGGSRGRVVERDGSPRAVTPETQSSYEARRRDRMP